MPKHLCLLRPSGLSSSTQGEGGEGAARSMHPLVLASYMARVRGVII